MTTVSLIVCAFNMQRELPRTLFTLSTTYQQAIPSSVHLEVIVLDNGSWPPVSHEEVAEVLPGARVVRPTDLRISPACAINEAIRQTSGELIGVWIDGARLASPGIIGKALDAWSHDRSKAIGTLAFHLGPVVQMVSVPEGYDAAFEDALLASIEWRQDGYSLFDVSVLAGSSANGWFGVIKETNALFVDRDLWGEIGGLDERFESAGGGYVNQDLWQRAVTASKGAPWIILGEGTFHQVHGGAATNGQNDDRTRMADEYLRIKGKPFSMPDYRPVFVGALTDRSALAGMVKPLDRLRRAQSTRLRPFSSSLPAKQLSAVQAGTLKTKYKGLRLAKSPFDLSLYMQLINRLRPASIIEIGASDGSAVWLSDQCRSLGVATHVVSIDMALPRLNAEGVTFIRGDAENPSATFPHELLDALPRPWIVIESSAHTHRSVTAVLSYFDERMLAGDWLVVEHGIAADLEGEVYRRLDDGPNQAVKELLNRKSTRYRIAKEYCDFYGRNVTWAPNSWLQRL